MSHLIIFKLSLKTIGNANINMTSNYNMIVKYTFNFYIKGVSSRNFCSDISIRTSWNLGQRVYNGEEGSVCQGFQHYTEYHR